MAVQGSDRFMISRAGVLYKITATDLLSYVEGQIGTAQYRVADITARNALNSSLSIGDRVMVDDATGDATVTSGWAIYQWLASNTWRKIAEQESLDLTVGGATNLGYVAAAGQGTVTSDTGNDAVLPLVTGVNAGLMAPADKDKVDFLTVTAATDLNNIRSKVAFITITQAVDLDALETASHAAVTTAGSATTNPIVATGQQLSFSIDNLTTAP